MSGLFNSMCLRPIRPAGLQDFGKVKGVLLKAAKGYGCSPVELATVATHAKDDVNQSTLATQLEVLSAAMAGYISEPTIQDVSSYLRSLPSPQHVLFS